MRTLILLLTGLVVFGVAPASASARCHGRMPIPDYPSANAYDNVQILRYDGMSCRTALKVAAAAYALPGLRPIYGPQFGGGGFGGPFHVGKLKCWLYSRGSDFRLADCRGDHKYVKFYDHREYYGVSSARAGSGITECGNFVPTPPWGPYHGYWTFRTVMGYTPVYNLTTRNVRCSYARPFSLHMAGYWRGVRHRDGYRCTNHLSNSEDWDIRCTKGRYVIHWQGGA